MIDAMDGVTALRGESWSDWMARRQLYRWARVHAAHFDVPLVAALYGTMLTVAAWKTAQLVQVEQGEYIATNWSSYLRR